MIIVFLIVLLLTNLAATIVTEFLHNNDYTADDQSAYLLMALHLLPQLQLTDGNRHPFYPLLLTPFAKEDMSFFYKAKFLSVAIAIVAIIVMVEVARRTVGIPLALLTGVLVAGNGLFAHYAATVGSEVLSQLLLFLAWSLFSRSARSSPRACFASGTFTGLAYLTKGTAIVFLVAVICYGFMPVKSTIGFKRYARRILLFGAGFAGAAAPLLLYNSIVYRNPFFNANTQYVFWSDSWDDVLVAYDNQLPSFSTYISSHSSSQMVTRLARGIFQCLKDYLDAMLPAFCKDGDWPWRTLLLSCLLFAWVRARNRRDSLLRTERGLLLAFGIVAIISFGWYAQVISATRFFLPFVFPSYLLIVTGCVGPLPRPTRTQGGGRSKPWKIHVLLVLNTIFTSGNVVTAFSKISSHGTWYQTFPSSEEEALLDEWLSSEAAGAKKAIFMYPSTKLPIWKYWRWNFFWTIPSACTHLEDMPRC